MATERISYLMGFYKFIDIVIVIIIAVVIIIIIIIAVTVILIVIFIPDLHRICLFSLYIRFVS